MISVATARVLRQKYMVQQLKNSEDPKDHEAAILLEEIFSIKEEIAKEMRIDDNLSKTFDF